MGGKITPSRIEIPLYPKGKRIAVTTSFDDGVVHDRRVIEAFNEWGLKGTFNLNSAHLLRTGKPALDSSGYIDACEVAGLYRGHEVAVHTATHPSLTMLDASQIIAEVMEDRKALEDLVGYSVRGMAYPYGTYDKRVIDILRQLGIVYARTVENSEPCFPPAEPLAWASTAHMFHNQPGPIDERFKQYYDSKYSRGVFCIWGHTYEFDRANRWQDLEKLFKPLSGKPDVWYCTNIELFDYEEARKRIVIAANKASVYNPNSISITLSLDGKSLEAAPGTTVF